VLHLFPEIIFKTLILIIQSGNAYLGGYYVWHKAIYTNR